jgi:hypothetical protein
MFNKVYLILLIIFVAASCRKREIDKDIQPSVDYMLIQNNLARIVPLVIHTVNNKERLNVIFADSIDTLNSCAKYFYVSGDTVDINNQDIEFKITFDMCMDADSVLKNGTVNCKIDNYLKFDGGLCRISFDDFSINGNELEGVIFITKKPGNEFTLQTIQLFQRFGTRRILYNGKMDYSMSYGALNDEMNDDVLTSADNGILTDIYNNEAEISNPGIRKSLGCSYFTNGLVEIVNDENVTQVLDIGNGACDNEIEITFEDESFIIRL